MIAYEVVRHRRTSTSPLRCWGPLKSPQWEAYQCQPYGWVHPILAVRFRRKSDAILCAENVGGWINRIET